MYLVAIAWMYVVLMMSVAEATSSNGSVLGAVVTFVLYGVLPLSIVMYLLHTPRRREARRAAEAAQAATDDSATAGVPANSDSGAPDGGHHASGDTIAPERKEP